MIVKDELKRNIILIITMFAILLGALSPTINVFAEEEDANAKFDSELSEYMGDSKDMKAVLEKIEADLEAESKPKKNTMPHIMKRMFNPGEYINDVEDGVLSNGLKVEREDLLSEDRFACNPNAPNNLINHNCNIPNFTTGLIQNVSSPFMTPFSNAEKTSSYSTFGFGVPDDIPGDTVPVSPGNRVNTYTALELFGYDLKLSSYHGEWDEVVVSNEARMLSNFGVIDTLTLMGTGLWNSIEGGMASLIEDFEFNPLRWIKNVSNALDGFLGGGINTVIDTSELNIVATNGWKRDGYSDTLYNVYVLTDKEVLSETARRYFRSFVDTMKEKSELSPEIKEALELESIPEFTLKEDWETQTSKKAREGALEYNKTQDDIYEATGTPPHYRDVPEPEYFTESQQLNIWGTNNADYLEKAASKGLISADKEDYDNYADLVAKWDSAYETYFDKIFEANEDVIDDLLEGSDEEIFTENPHLDPKQQISHYACIDENGAMMRDADKNPEYLYTKNNKGTEEFINPKCSKARAPIGGGLMGSGWHTLRDPDTRHKDNISEDYFGIYQRFLNGSMSVGRTVNSFIAKLTNTVLGLSFSPILSELGIDVIVSELINGFRDTIFFPMAALVTAIGAILLFFQVLRSGSIIQLISSVGITLLIFIVGTMFLLHPQSAIKVVDELPTRLDNFLAEAVLVDDDGTSYCSTGSDEDGIRSAQCNVWGAMVFNPWVHLQFGTGYDNLYANGTTAANGGSTMENTNGELVGDASVYMGDGHTVNNWAMYQLDKTKAGTINEYDSSNKQGIGKVDPDMYRIVDLQAGPDNAAGADTRFFNTWSGLSGGNPGISILTMIQAIIMGIALIGLGFMKIETSFMFAISLVFLPFMLLFALIPQGKPKLRGYLANLVSLLIKRSVIVVMLAVLLKTLNLTYAQVDSLTTAAIISIAICVAFIMYRKELLDLITRTEGGLFTATGELTQKLKDNAPKAVRHKVASTKAKAKGLAAGFVGGAAGYSASKRTAKTNKSELSDKIRDLDKKEKDIGLNENEKILKDKFRNEVATIEANLENAKITDKGGITAAVDGAKSSGQLIGRRAERKIRREGHSISSIYKNAKDTVHSEGADSITNKEEPTALDTYSEIISHSETNASKTEHRKLSREEGRLLRDPKVQREVRRLAEKREQIAEENKDNKDYKAISPDVEEMEKIAKTINKKRRNKRLKGKIFHPFVEKDIQKETDELEKADKVTTNVDDIKEEILETQNEEQKKADDLAERLKEEREAKDEKEEQEQEQTEKDNKNKGDDGQ